MWVKICGTTNLEDAIASVEAGADALGFIFAPSPRRISPKDAAKIIRELPPAGEKIGVFVNQKAEIIRQTVAETGLTGVQLQGDENAEEVEALRGALPHQLRIIKGIRAHDGFAAAFDRFSGQGVPDVFLLDSGTASARGGTGKRFDWDANASFVRLATRKYKIVIAGGLDPGNVAQAIGRFAPYGVDVVSGVEREPGRKDHDKLRAFVAAAKQAGSSPASRDRNDKSGSSSVVK